ncbi:uncharacterized protein BDR25DRAFT_124749 [Lindgomyces ingoldianus]|uniref:Uncharacterized protein n=1 Tax=Lindgomyces ingoldianus TaxID=673940 RepID=A0ACB6R3A8_9PLEO|nr:uncharacterized protein BDR25DRAFT_124749 [Lindgomyces ingoldianus]KAF2473743.1 hypothetical protein BDR25DRAFT_124749 [Lindgomyces ingoldianus]
MGSAIDANERKPRHERPYKQEQEWLVLAYVALLIRSFCEVVIVGQLDRHPRHLQDILRARNVTYHLFSVSFAATILKAIPCGEDVDPLVQEETEAINFVRDFVLRRINELTDHEKKTAPQITTILDEVEQAQQGFQVKNEVKRLRAIYKGWEPIYKWNGPDS